MLQFMGSQRVRHDLVNEQQQIEMSGEVKSIKSLLKNIHEGVEYHFCVLPMMGSLHICSQSL